MARKNRCVIRKGTLKIGENLYLQPAGHWGPLDTARRFSSSDKADRHARKVGLLNFGVFPAGPRKPAQWPRDMQMEAHKLGFDIFLNDDRKFYLQALDDPHDIAAEAAEFHGLDPDKHPYTGPDFFKADDYPDDHAMKFVIERAQQGDPVCRRAIEFLLDRKSPDAQAHGLDKVLIW